LPLHDEFDDDFRSVFGITSKNNSIEAPKLLNMDKKGKITEKNHSQNSEYPPLSTKQEENSHKEPAEDDIPDLFGTKSKESIHKEISETTISSINPSSVNIPAHSNERELYISPPKIPKPVPIVPITTPFWGARPLEETSLKAATSPPNTEELPDKTPLKSRQTSLPTELSKISSKKEPKPNNSDSDNKFISFLKGAIHKEHKIKDEDDYLPAKPPPPPPKEEEIDESELIGQPNPIWG